MQPTLPKRIKPRRGRPPRSDKAATERVEIKLTRLERAAWEHAAAAAGVSVSEWVRAACQDAAATGGPWISHR